MVCDRVAILVKGQVAMQGTIETLTADSRRIEVDVEGDAPEWADEAFDTVESINGATRCARKWNQARKIICENGSGVRKLESRRTQDETTRQSKL